jgi:hypothetical protein
MDENTQVTPTQHRPARVKLTLGNWFALTTLCLAPAGSLFAFGISVREGITEAKSVNASQDAELRRHELLLTNSAQTQQELLRQVERIAGYLEASGRPR